MCVRRCAWALLLAAAMMAAAARPAYADWVTIDTTSGQGNVTNSPSTSSPLVWMTYHVPVDAQLSTSGTVQTTGYAQSANGASASGTLGTGTESVSSNITHYLSTRVINLSLPTRDVTLSGTESGSVGTTSTVDLSVCDWGYNWTPGSMIYIVWSTTAQTGQRPLPAGARIQIDLPQRVLVGLSDDGIISTVGARVGALQVYGYYGSGASELVEYDSDGLYTLPRSYYRLELRWSVGSSGNAPVMGAIHGLGIMQPTIRRWLPDGADVVQGQQQQTQTLMDTSGASSGMLPVQAPDFQVLEGTGQGVITFLQSPSSSSGAVLDFPGIDLGYFALPPARVDVWSYLGDELHSKVQTGCSVAAIFVWIRGVKSWVDRFFNLKRGDE